MFRSCSRCGKIHDTNYKCNVGRNNTNEAKLRNTHKWHSKAAEIKENSNYLCAVCKEEGRYTYDNLEIHHIVKIKDDPTKLLDNYNLICLCVYHHKLADAGKISKEYLLKLAENREK